MTAPEPVSATLVLLFVYAALLVAAGVFVARRVRGSGDFFVASRALPGSMVFVTMLAANIGAGSTVGATGLAYRHGLSAWWWSGSAAIGCLVLGLLVAPRMHRLAAEHRFFTVGDFLEWRFDRSVRVVIAAVLWLGTLALLAGQLIAMAWALEVIAGLPGVAGALVGVAHPRPLLQRRGPPGLGLGQPAPAGDPARGLPAGPAVRLDGRRRLAGHARGGRGRGGRARTGASPGWAAAGILGLAVVFVPSFFVSPGLVQKTFGARSPSAARWAALGNAAALAAFAFVPAVFGMAMRAVEPGLSNPELALPRLTTDVLPPWVGGLALAALFAAEISTADAVLFMLSTSLSRDLFQAVLRPKATDAELLRVGRLAAALGGAARRPPRARPAVRGLGAEALLRGHDRGALHAPDVRPALAPAGGRARARGRRGRDRDDRRAAPSS